MALVAPPVATPRPLVKTRCQLAITIVRVGEQYAVGLHLHA